MPQQQIEICVTKILKLCEEDKRKENKEEGIKHWDYDTLVSYYWIDGPGREERKIVSQSNLLVSMLKTKFIIKQTNAFARNKGLIYGMFIAGCPWFRITYGKQF